MKKRFLVVPSIITATCLLLSSGFVNASILGGRATWDYSSSDYDTVGHYTPLDGEMEYRIYDNSGTSSDYLKTRVDFNPTIHNAETVTDYIHGRGTGGSCYGENAYWTLDVTATGDMPEDPRIDAYSIATDLPDAKEDLEYNSTTFRNESEVVALAEIDSSEDYYMSTYWKDYRRGYTYDDGIFQAQFAMSTLGWSDYNNCTQSKIVQAEISYGEDRMQP